MPSRPHPRGPLGTTRPEDPQQQTIENGNDDVIVDCPAYSNEKPFHDTTNRPSAVDAVTTAPQTPSSDGFEKGPRL